MTSLALCMIVANEAENLPRCLESVSSWVDAIYITDTGSTDATIQIAEKYGAQIRRFPWIGDFSAARNFSIAQTPEEWILMLDADDFFPEGEAEKIRPHLNEGPVAFTLNYHIQAGHTPAPGLKLFKNHQGIRYEGYIHEYIRNSLAAIPEARIGALDITLLHSGYTKETEPRKAVRNLPLLRKEWIRATTAREFRQILYVGKSLAACLGQLAQPVEAESVLRQLLKSMEESGRVFSDDWEIGILVELVTLLQNQNRSEEARHACAESAPFFQGHPVFELYYGISLFHTAQYRQAVEHLHAFETMWARKPLSLSIPEGYTQARLWELQGHSHLALENYNAAIEAFTRCAAAFPEREDYRVKLKLTRLMLKNYGTA